MICFTQKIFMVLKMSILSLPGAQARNKATLPLKWNYFVEEEGKCYF